MDRDIIERLLDFEREGVTAAQRVNLREEAAGEIFRLRNDLSRVVATLKTEQAEQPHR